VSLLDRISAELGNYRKGESLGIASASNIKTLEDINFVAKTNLIHDYVQTLHVCY
jgi:hypothetical protein